MNWAAAFLELSQWLRSTEQFWQPSPFVHETPPWLADHPSLAQNCLQWAPAQLDDFAAQPYSELHWLQQQLPQLSPLPGVLALGLRDPPARSAAQTRAAAGVPGRKWEQICAFSQVLRSTQQPLLDWCCGKSHLGRYLARRDQRALHGVERNPKLCEQGQLLAQQHGLDCNYQIADVLTDSTDIPRGSVVVALHACGDLHRSLINHAHLHHVSQLYLAPCCYHLWLQGNYQPQSALGRQHDLRLNRNQVQLAVQDLLHAPARERRAHHTMAAWRLAFDSLQRELRGDDCYVSTPSLPHRVLKEGFAAFIQRLAAHEQLALPAQIDWKAWETQGWTRLERARRLQVVRHAFRRPLEMWLVLDIALRLQERGFSTEITPFCPRQTTPRNLLLRGYRRD